MVFKDAKTTFSLENRKIFAVSYQNRQKKDIAKLRMAEQTLINASEREMQIQREEDRKKRYREKFQAENFHTRKLSCGKHSTRRLSSRKSNNSEK